MGGRWIRNEAASSAAVFVHGINSDENAFRSESAFWPDILSDDAELRSLDIFAFEYRTKISAPGYTLGDAVDFLHEIMKIERLYNYREIIFICHSMGGNLVRRLLVKEGMMFAQKQIQVGLILIASPSTGSHYANLFRLIKKNHHMQLESLVASQKNVWLNDLDKDFRNLLHHAPFKIIGRELVEDLPIIGGFLMPRTQVVSPLSASRYFGEPIKIPGSNHLTIAAPHGRSDIQHLILKDFIKEHFLLHSTAPNQNPEIIAQEFASLVDAQDYPAVWSMLDPLAQQSQFTGFDEFSRIFSVVIQLGENTSRSLVGSNQLSDPPGYVKGIYKIFQYISEYSIGGKRTEQITLRKDWDGKWRPFSYTISPTTITTEPTKASSSLA